MTAPTTKSSCTSPASTRPATLEGATAVTAAAVAPAYVACVMTVTASAPASTSPARVRRMASPGCRYRARCRPPPPGVAPPRPARQPPPAARQPQHQQPGDREGDDGVPGGKAQPAVRHPMEDRIGHRRPGPLPLHQQLGDLLQAEL